MQIIYQTVPFLYFVWGWHVFCCEKMSQKAPENPRIRKKRVVKPIINDMEKTLSGETACKNNPIHNFLTITDAKTKSNDIICVGTS